MISFLHDFVIDPQTGAYLILWEPVLLVVDYTFPWPGFMPAHRLKPKNIRNLCEEIWKYSLNWWKSKNNHEILYWRANVSVPQPWLLWWTRTIGKLSEYRGHALQMRTSERFLPFFTAHFSSSFRIFLLNIIVICMFLFTKIYQFVTYPNIITCIFVTNPKMFLPDIVINPNIKHCCPQLAQVLRAGLAGNWLAPWANVKNLPFPKVFCTF